MTNVQQFLPNEFSSQALAATLADFLSPPLILTFSGEIGAGKTTFIRALLRALGVETTIKSPTFSLIESYSVKDWRVHHFDLYRIHDESELEYIGFRDYFREEAICCIEWPQRAPHHLKKIDVDFAFTIKGSGRMLSMNATSFAGGKNSRLSCRSTMSIRTVILGLLMAVLPPIMAAQLLSVEVKQEGKNPSILLTLDRAVAHKVFTLTNPNRVVLDFADTKLAVDLNHVNLGKRLIRYIRSGYPNPKTLRLVFEVDQAVLTKMKPIPSSTVLKHRFALDLSTTYPTAVSHNSPKMKPIAKANPAPVLVSHSPNRRLRDVIVVLDPGHGGKDPGAIGPKRTVEKMVTLAMARRLKQTINRQPGMRAVLTRDGDYYIGLRERLKIARKYNADIFISIHADAFNNPHSSGASVFALSQSGATSEAARWLAEKENYSELGGVNLSGLDDKNGLVPTVLIDLSQTATIGASLHMGEHVLTHLYRITDLHNHKVEQARFMVLKSPDIPSILIETGFISNPREEKNLTNANYQTRLTQAIFDGLKRYFWDYPPHGTRIEALAGNRNRHLVREENAFPKMASKSPISIAALSSRGHLR